MGLIPQKTGRREEKLKPNIPARPAEPKAEQQTTKSPSQENEIYARSHLSPRVDLKKRQTFLKGRVFDTPKPFGLREKKRLEREEEVEKRMEDVKREDEDQSAIKNF